MKLAILFTLLMGFSTAFACDKQKQVSSETEDEIQSETRISSNDLDN